MDQGNKQHNEYIHPMVHTTDTIWNACCCTIKSFILKRVKDPFLADDILQEVFIKIHAKLNTLKDGTKIHSWAFQIVRNTIIDYYRQHKIKTENIHDENIQDSGSLNVIKDHKERDLENEITSGLLPLIKSLPPKYAQALIYVEYQGMSQVNFAKKLKITSSAAKSRVQRARQMVKDQLMNCCHYEFDKYGTVIGVHPKTCCCCKNQ